MIIKLNCKPKEFSRLWDIVADEYEEAKKFYEKWLHLDQSMRYSKDIADLQSKYGFYDYMYCSLSSYTLTGAYSFHHNRTLKAKAWHVFDADEILQHSVCLSDILKEIFYLSLGAYTDQVVKVKDFEMYIEQNGLPYVCMLNGFASLDNHLMGSKEDQEMCFSYIEELNLHTMCTGTSFFASTKEV